MQSQELTHIPKLDNISKLYELADYPSNRPKKNFEFDFSNYYLEK